MISVKLMSIIGLCLIVGCRPKFAEERYVKFASKASDRYALQHQLLIMQMEAGVASAGYRTKDVKTIEKVRTINALMKFHFHECSEIQELIKNWNQPIQETLLRAHPENMALYRLKRAQLENILLKQYRVGLGSYCLRFNPIEEIIFQHKERNSIIKGYYMVDDFSGFWIINERDSVQSVGFLFEPYTVALEWHLVDRIRISNEDYDKFF